MSTKIKLTINIDGKDTIIACKEMKDVFKLKEIQSDNPSNEDIEDFININLFNN